MEYILLNNCYYHYITAINGNNSQYTRNIRKGTVYSCNNRKNKEITRNTPVFPILTLKYRYSRYLPNKC